jgi:hypothetical protein
MTTVVHINDPYDIYIGRPSIWGNPHSHLPESAAEYIVATRKEAIEKYREYILNSNYLMSRLPELEGKVLGCHCKQKSKNVPCHGDVLVELIEKMNYTKVDLENL